MAEASFTVQEPSLSERSASTRSPCGSSGLLWCRSPSLCSCSGLSLVRLAWLCFRGRASSLRALGEQSGVARMSSRLEAEAADCSQEQQKKKWRGRSRGSPRQSRFLISASERSKQQNEMKTSEGVKIYLYDRLSSFDCCLSKKWPR